MLEWEQVQKFRRLLASPRGYTQEQAAKRANIPESYDLSRLAAGLIYKLEEAS